MRNLFNTPHQAVRMLATRLPFTTALNCESLAPFLMPFSENTLDAKTHARIARHIAGCPACQAEVQMLSAMADFFRANPPQTAAPAPNLWQSIEAQIQAETPERIAAFKANPQVASTPRRTRFDWNSFVRSFAATGGVMTAVVACVWIFAARHPLEKPLPNPAQAVAMAPEAEPSTTIQLVPKRPASVRNKPITQVAPHTARVPAMRARASVAMPHRPQDLQMLDTRRIAGASFKRGVTVVATSGKRFGSSSSLPVQPQQALEGYIAIARSAKPLVSSVRVNKSVPPPPAQSFASAGAIVSDSIRSDKPEGARAGADTQGEDALPVVRKMLDAVLEQATVAAVAASLSARSQEANVPVLAALSVAGNLPAHDGVIVPEENGIVVPRNLGAAAVTAEESAHRAARRTQVGWLVEDGTRSERSTADATCPERRQQSLFSYGSR